jgi:hypothetical protein
MEKMALTDSECCSKFMESKKLAEELNLNRTTFFKPEKTVYVKIMLKIFSAAQNKASEPRFSNQDPSKNLTFFKRY